MRIEPRHVGPEGVDADRHRHRIDDRGKEHRRRRAVENGAGTEIGVDARCQGQHCQRKARHRFDGNDAVLQPSGSAKRHGQTPNGHLGGTRKDYIPLRKSEETGGIKAYYAHGCVGCTPCMPKPPSAKKPSIAWIGEMAINSVRKASDASSASIASTSAESGRSTV